MVALIRIITKNNYMYIIQFIFNIHSFYITLPRILFYKVYCYKIYDYGQWSYMIKRQYSVYIYKWIHGSANHLLYTFKYFVYNIWTLILSFVGFCWGGGHLIETNNSHTFKILPLKTDLDYYSTCKIHITITFPKISQLFHVDLKLVDFYGIFFQFWVCIFNMFKTQSLTRRFTHDNATMCMTYVDKFIDTFC